MHIARLVAHGRLHLEDLGFSTAMAASVLGTMILVSIAGRLTGSLGDFIKPERVLAVGLVLEGLGVVGLLYAGNDLRQPCATDEVYDGRI